MATHTDEKLELLKRTPLLAGLGRKDLEEVGRLADEVDLKADHVLMREGDVGREFFVIVEGQVRIDKGGRAIRTMGPGEFVGDIALVTERPRTATATTETPCRRRRRDRNSSSARRREPGPPRREPGEFMGSRWQRSRGGRRSNRARGSARGGWHTAGQS